MSTIVRSGKVVIDLSGNFDVAYSLALDQQGNVYVAGETYGNGNNDLGVIKLNASGVLDNTFGENGKAIIDISGNSYDTANFLALDEQGNVYVAGYTNANGSFNYDFGVIKLDSSGVLDSEFGVDGKAIIDIGANFDVAYSLALDEQGNVYVAGFANVNGSDDFVVIKLNASGELDNTFSVDGKAIIDLSGNSRDTAYSLALDQQGNVYVAGHTIANGSFNYDFGVIKLIASGELDTSFGENGKAIIDFSGNSFDRAFSLVLDQQGNVYVAGYTNANGLYNQDFVVIKLDASGVLDTSFGENGKANIDLSGNSSDLAYSLALDEQGNVYVAGYTIANGSFNYDFGVIKLDASGVLDSGFGDDGKAIIDLSGNSLDKAFYLALDEQGNVYVAGETNANGSNDFGVIKLTARGELANDFGEKRNILKERLLESSKNTYFF
jgi:uncharacterized delta-60 repeat protein